MAVQTITYDDKVALNSNSGIADINKVNDSDMNMIKSVVNNNATNIGDLSNLITPTTSSIVGAINSVVESGSDSNGSYVKYADGTMICYKTVTGTTNISTSWGSLYVSSSVSLGNYPVSFVSVPTVTVTPQSQSGTQFMMTTNDANGFGTISTPAPVCLVRPNSRTGVGYIFNVIAVGKWK